jgi:hypothetical protein
MIFEEGETEEGKRGEMESPQERRKISFVAAAVAAADVLVVGVSTVAWLLLLVGNTVAVLENAVAVLGMVVSVSVEQSWWQES